MQLMRAAMDACGRAAAAAPVVLDAAAARLKLLVSMCSISTRTAERTLNL
jgi:hypothetical protein